MHSATVTDNAHAADCKESVANVPATRFQATPQRGGARDRWSAETSTMKAVYTLSNKAFNIAMCGKWINREFPSISKCSLAEDIIKSLRGKSKKKNKEVEMV